MATKQARGTKRTCQNGECGARFYDLNREPVVCPVCSTVYDLAQAAAALAALEEKSARRPKKPDFPVKAAPPEVVAEVETEEVLPDIEDGEEVIAADEDETFLEEEEEEGGAVSTIIGGPVKEGGEER